jgi:hypothetical protein
LRIKAAWCSHSKALHSCVFAEIRQPIVLRAFGRVCGKGWGPTDGTGLSQTEGAFSAPRVLSQRRGCFLRARVLSQRRGCFLSAQGAFSAPRVLSQGEGAFSARVLSQRRGCFLVAKGAFSGRVLSQGEGAFSKTFFCIFFLFFHF